MSDIHNAELGVVSETPNAETANPILLLPEPTAIGNDRIEILKHSLVQLDTLSDRAHHPRPWLELVIRNSTNRAIATMLFKVDFYDQAGNLIETVKHREIALEPDRSRAVVINFSPYGYEKIKSYTARLIRTTTAEEEKVQLRRHESNTTETGEERITGIVKNLSNAKADAAVVVTFYDTQDEIIATKVVILRDIEANSLGQYELEFQPRDGDQIGSYTIGIGDLVN